MSSKSLCHACVGDPVLSAEIRATGVKAQCRSCDHRRKAWPMMQVAERIHEVLQANYNLVRGNPYGEYGYGNDGEEPAFVITELAGLEDEEIGRELQVLLSERHGTSARYRDDEDDFYGEDAAYRFADADTVDLRLSWIGFCETLKKRSRFFSTSAQAVLDDIFGNLGSLHVTPRQPVIRTMPAGSGGTSFFRGRVATTKAALERILADPVRELSAPPPELARAGRMNGFGISLFYGALDAETCLAELRAPVGGNVVITAFRNTRPLRLLDLERLRSTSAGGSMFVADFRSRYEFGDFLEHLVKELSRPIMPGAEELDYLPTQAVAEYLANREDLALDGMLFPSSQLEGDNLNIVLFHAASRTKGRGIPDGSETSLLGPRTDEDGQPESIAVWVHPLGRKKRLSPDGTSSKAVQASYPFGDMRFSDDDSRQPTLQLLPETLEVHSIRSVSYSTDRHSVNRYVEPKRKKYPF